MRKIRVLFCLMLFYLIGMSTSYATVCQGHVASYQEASGGHKIICSICKVELSTESHYGGTLTCTQGKVCTACNATYVAPLGHVGGTETCLKGKICTRCNTEYTAALGHALGATWTKNSTSHWKICTRCKAVQELSAHTGGTATCTASPICTVCGRSYDKALGHITPTTYTYDANRHWKVCGRAGCGVIVVDYVPHYKGTATTTASKKCATCGASYGDVLTYSLSYTANKPEIVEGMVPVKWNGVYWVTATANDSDWYTYKNGTEKWANVTLKDGLEYYASDNSGAVIKVNGNATVPVGVKIKNTGSMFVWIPRYTYVLNETNNITIRWSRGTVDLPTTNSILPVAFSYGDKQLNGFWMGKYEASQAGGTIAVKPGMSSYATGIASAYSLCKEFISKTANNTGVEGNAISHLAKDSEWQAVSYLTDAIKMNPYNNNSNITGVAGASQDLSNGTTYPWNSVYGRRGSTTGSIYGIYDMAGGRQEYVAGLFDANQTLINSSALGMTYLEEYLNIDKYLDIPTDTKQWNGDGFVVANSSKPFITRGGSAANGAEAGIFAYGNAVGTEALGFRPTIVVGDFGAKGPEVALSPETLISAGENISSEIIFTVSQDWKFGNAIENVFLKNIKLCLVQNIGDAKVENRKLQITLKKIQNSTGQVFFSEDNAVDLVTTVFPKGTYSVKFEIAGEASGHFILSHNDSVAGKLLLETLQLYSGNTGAVLDVEDIEANRILINGTSKEATSANVSAISVYKKPYKLIYKVGEAIDLTGGILNVTYDDGKISYLSMEGMTGTLDTSTVGSKTLRVNFNGKTTSIGVTVNSSAYNLTFSNTDYGTLTGKGTYPAGTKVKITAEPEPGYKFLYWTASNGTFQNEKSSTTYFTIPTGDVQLSAVFTNATSISVLEQPNKLVYKVDEAIELIGGRIKVTFADGSIDIVDMVGTSVRGMSNDGTNKFSTTGSKIITLYYGNLTVGVTVTVK